MTPSALKSVDDLNLDFQLRDTNSTVLEFGVYTGALDRFIVDDEDYRIGVEAEDAYPILKLAVPLGEPSLSCLEAVDIPCKTYRDGIEGIAKGRVAGLPKSEMESFIV